MTSSTLGRDKFDLIYAYHCDSKDEMDWKTYIEMIVKSTTLKNNARLCLHSHSMHSLAKSKDNLEVKDIVQKSNVSVFFLTRSLKKYFDNLPSSSTTDLFANYHGTLIMLYYDIDVNYFNDVKRQIPDPVKAYRFLITSDKDHNEQVVKDLKELIRMKCKNIKPLSDKTMKIFPEYGSAEERNNVVLWFRNPYKRPGDIVVEYIGSNGENVQMTLKKINPCSYEFQIQAGFGGAIQLFFYTSDGMELGVRVFHKSQGCTEANDQSLVYIALLEAMVGQIDSGQTSIMDGALTHALDKFKPSFYLFNGCDKYSGRCEAKVPTLLHFAVKNKFERMTYELLKWDKAGVAIDLANKDNETALQMASSQENIKSMMMTYKDHMNNQEKMYDYIHKYYRFNKNNHTDKTEKDDPSEYIDMGQNPEETNESSGDGYYSAVEYPVPGVNDSALGLEQGSLQHDKIFAFIMNEVIAKQLTPAQAEQMINNLFSNKTKIYGIKGSEGQNKVGKKGPGVTKVCDYDASVPVSFRGFGRSSVPDFEKIDIKLSELGEDEFCDIEDNTLDGESEPAPPVPPRDRKNSANQKRSF